MFDKNFIKIITYIFLLFTMTLINPQNCFASSAESRLIRININWWENFSDPYIKDYICRALANNHEIKKAALKTEEYRQMVKVTQSKEFPSLMISPTFARIKTAQNQFFDIETATVRTNLYAIPLFAQYEADIFLKNHDKTKSSKKEFEAVQYEEKAADITLAADVATSLLQQMWHHYI